MGLHDRPYWRDDAGPTGGGGMMRGMMGGMEGGMMMGGMMGGGPPQGAQGMGQ